MDTPGDLQRFIYMVTCTYTIFMIWALVMEKLDMWWRMNEMKKLAEREEVSLLTYQEWERSLDQAMAEQDALNKRVQQLSARLHSATPVAVPPVPRPQAKPRERRYPAHAQTLPGNR